MTAMEVLEVMAWVVGIIVGVGAIVGVLVSWRKKLLSPFRQMVTVVNLFMGRILPLMLEGFEKRHLVPESTLARWTILMCDDILSTASPIRLSEEGGKLLEESGIRKLIDDSIDSLLSELEAEELDSLQDVQLACFCVLKATEDTAIAVPLKNYLYRNPGQDINTIFCAGSIYLGDRYLEKHPELLQNENLERKTRLT